MDSFLVGLGRKLAEKWVTLLVLPGALFVSVTAVAIILGQGGWADIDRLVRTGNQLVAGLAPGEAPTRVILILIGILLASVAIGMVSRAGGRVIEYVWLASWSGTIATAIISYRRRAWNDAHEKFVAEASARQPGQEKLDAAARARNRISLVEPRRPTWLADRVVATVERVHSEYNLDMEFAWPRLWLVMPEGARSEIRSARDQFDSAVGLIAWGIMYAGLGTIWWPSTLIGVCLYIAGWWRTRNSVAVLVDLIEAAVDLYSSDLATAVGVHVEDRRLTPEVGRAVSKLCRKGA
jgi:hypothetical protein